MKVDGLIDLNLLVGGSRRTSAEDKIDPKKFKKVWSDYTKVRSFWGKACFIVFLMLNRDESIKACGIKIKRMLMENDYDVYVRHIEPYLSSIKKKNFIDTTGKTVADIIKSRLIDYGELEFVVLCKVVYNSGYIKILEGMDNVSIKLDKIADIEDGY